VERVHAAMVHKHCNTLTHALSWAAAEVTAGGPLELTNHTARSRRLKYKFLIPGRVYNFCPRQVRVAESIRFPGILHLTLRMPRTPTVR
jgi:hypothetical protein